MKISVLCTNKDHPAYPWLERWKSWTARNHHSVELVQCSTDLSGGDVLFLVSCHEILADKDRSRYRAVLVIHASDLPEGRGWSPHVWQIIEGRSDIVVTLLEAGDKLDAGAIWAQRKLHLEGHELSNEINQRLFGIELELMDFAVSNFGAVTPHPQDGRTPTYYRRRTPEDSRLDPHKTIAEQFELLRAADSSRFAAFFDFRGHRYIVRVEKDKNSEE